MIILQGIVPKGGLATLGILRGDVDESEEGGSTSMGGLMSAWAAYVVGTALGRALFRRGEGSGSVVEDGVRNT